MIPQQQQQHCEHEEVCSYYDELMGFESFEPCIPDSCKHDTRTRPAPSHETCIWTQNEEEYGNYETECGHAFQTIEGDVKENNFKFCTYCGRKIQEEMR